MKHKLLIILSLVLLIGLTFLLSKYFILKNSNKVQETNISPSATKEEKTEVITYKQTYIPDKSLDGDCWTESIAASSNTNALRCSVGNLIHDPCFITETNQVVCEPDPESSESGFLLKLTKNSIIKNVKFKSDESTQAGEIYPWPWMIELKNGLKCYTMTGTAGYINGEWYYRYCGSDAKIVLLGDIDKFIDMKGQPWKVRVAYLSDDYEKIEKSETVDVIRIWE